MNPRALRLLPPLILATGTLFLFRLWAGPGILYSDHSDLLAHDAGLLALEGRTLVLERRWPLWNPSVDAGMPAHAYPPATCAFPLYWPLLLLPVDRAANLGILLNVLLAGLAMFVCARRVLEHPYSALFCAVAYMLSYRYLSMIDAGWTNALTMYALAPLLFWSADRLLERPDRKRTAAFALILGLAAMQGSAQLFYYSLLGLAALAAWRAPGLERSVQGRAALALAGGGTLAFLLAAPDLLPRAQFAALSTRSIRDYAFFLGRAPGFSSLATLLDPRDAGGTRLEYWENNFYFGLALYPLALWGCLKDWKKSRPLLLAFSVCVLLSFDTPLLRLLFRFLPGFASFRLTTRLLQTAQLPATLLAGIGADALLNGLARRRAAAAAAILCLLPVLDSGARMLPRLRTAPLSQALPEPAFAELLRRSPTSGRVAALGRTVLPYGTAPYHGIDLVNGYAPLNLKHYIDYFSVLQNGDPARTPRAPIVWTDLTAVAKPDMLRALDVRYVIGDRPAPLAAIGYDLVGRREGVPVYRFYEGLGRSTVYLWRDRRPLGPAYFATALTPVAGEAESLAAVAASTSVRRANVLGWDGAGGVPFDFAGGSAALTRRGENVYEYSLDSRGENFLILSQVWYPGWRATLDGKELALYRVNHALIGCVVPAGAHALRLEMTSPALRLGLALCALGAAALAALTFLRIMRSPRES